MNEIVYLPSLEEIAREFVTEVEALGGSMLECVTHHDRLYARATWDSSTSVRPGDRVRAGVALRAGGPSIEVCPYFYRQICANGAIQAHAVGSRSVARNATERTVSAAATGAIAINDLRSAIQACAHPDVANHAFGAIQYATEHRVSVMLQLMPLLARVSEAQRPAVAEHLRLAIQNFNSGDDESLFGLMNAVTATGRGLADHETRWQLESMGMALLVLRPERERMEVGLVTTRSY